MDGISFILQTAFEAVGSDFRGSCQKRKPRAREAQSLERSHKLGNSETGFGTVSLIPDLCFFPGCHKGDRS